MAQGSEKTASGAPPRRQSNRTTRSIQKKTTRRAAPAKVRSKKRRVEKKLAGTHTRDLESILADKVLKKNERLKVLKPDPKVVEREKLREQKKRKKRG